MRGLGVKVRRSYVGTYLMIAPISWYELEHEDFEAVYDPTDDRENGGWEI
jgi:hypothetical protein